MNIQINGEIHTVTPPITVSGLVAHLGLAVGKIAIERNLEIVPKSSFETLALCDGDRLEIVQFVGGG